MPMIDTSQEMNAKASACVDDSRTNQLWPYLALAAVVIIVSAAIVWSHAHPFGVHWDEAEYLDQAGIDVQRLLAGNFHTLGGRILMGSVGRPPAYRIIVLPFLAAFGFHVMVARLVSLMCFASSAWFVFRAGRLVGGQNAGAFAVLVFALSPEVISASIFFGTDAPLYLATAAMFCYSFQAWQEKSDQSRPWVGLGLALGFGFLAKTSFFAIAIPFLIFWLIAGHFGFLGIPSLLKQVKSIGLAFVLGGPWWVLNLKKSFEYTQYARGFVRNSLGSPSFETWVRWLYTVSASLIGYGLAFVLSSLLIRYLARAIASRNLPLTALQKAAILGCICAGLPIVFAQLAGTNHLLRHISPSMIPIAVFAGVLAESSGWMRSRVTSCATFVAFLAQLLMLVTPVAMPNRQPIDLAFSNGGYPWQAMARFDQWNWDPVRSLGQGCGLAAPRFAYLGNGREFDPPQIQYAWISDRLTPPEVTWLWRYEDGAIDWSKVMSAADESDIVITAPGFAGEAKIKENIDNEHNTEFANRLAQDPLFRPPFQFFMGRFEPVELLVFVKRSAQCPADAALPTGE